MMWSRFTAANTAAPGPGSGAPARPLPKPGEVLLLLHEQGDEGLMLGSMYAGKGLDDLGDEDSMTVLLPQIPSFSTSVTP